MVKGILYDRSFLFYWLPSSPNRFFVMMLFRLVEMVTDKRKLTYTRKKSRCTNAAAFLFIQKMLTRISHTRQLR
jgi:hypothetical protein